MQGDHHPRPQRFQVFTQLPNGKGFRIKNSKYIYMFDKYGGFYDEYNNYYSSDGQPEDPPSDEDDYFQKVILEDQQDYDDDDYYENQYGGTVKNNYEDDYEDSPHKKGDSHKILEAISHNHAHLQDYPIKTALRVDFLNMTFKTNKQEILKHYTSKIGKGILNVILSKEDGEFIGQGYFVCEQVTVAQKLIKLQGQQFLGRKVNFQVQTFQHLLADPVTKQELNKPINEDQFQSLVKDAPKIQEYKEEKKKKYKTKSQSQSNQKCQQKTQPIINVKKQQPHIVKEQAEAKKVEKVKILQKQQPTWSKYKGDMSMFPKREHFADFMHSFGFKLQENYKTPVKMNKDDKQCKMVILQLRSDAFQKIEGLIHNNQKVHFQKIQ